MGMDSEQRENMAKATMDSLNKIPSALQGHQLPPEECDKIVEDNARNRGRTMRQESEFDEALHDSIERLDVNNPNPMYEDPTPETHEPPWLPFPRLGQEIGELLEEKRKHYGQSFYRSENFLKLLYPNGLPLEEYDNALALIRIFDKMNRVASPNKDTDEENPWKDMAGYAMLGTRLWKKTTTSCDQQDQHRKGMTCSKCGEYTC